jgi:hypothetical protein
MVKRSKNEAAMFTTRHMNVHVRLRITTSKDQKEIFLAFLFSQCMIVESDVIDEVGNLILYQLI